MAKPEI